MGSATNFDKLRIKIDSLDEEILNLLNQRGDIALEIRKLKMENSVSVYDPVREKLIEDKLKDIEESIEEEQIDSNKKDENPKKKEKEY